jgi:hypothetical protein
MTPDRIAIMHKRWGSQPGTCATCQNCHLVPIGGGGPRRDRMPLAGHQIAGRHQTRHQHRQRRIFHQLHLFNSFLNGFT